MTKMSWLVAILGAYRTSVHIAPWFAVAGFIIIAYLTMTLNPRG